MPRFGGLGRAFGRLGVVVKKATAAAGGGSPAQADNTTGASEYLIFLL